MVALLAPTLAARVAASDDPAASTTNDATTESGGTPVSTPAQAAPHTVDDATASGDGYWNFKISPYLWFAGITGNLAVSNAAPPVHVSKDFSDIFKHLRFATSGSGEAWRGRLGIVSNFAYVDLGSTSDVSGPFLDSARAESQSVLVGTAVAFRVLGDTGSRLELLAGARGTWTENKLALNFTPDRLPLSTSLIGDKSVAWADGFGGVRAKYEFNDHWSITAYGDGGAGASEYTYQAFATVNYDLNHNWSVSGGYRYYRDKYSNAQGFLYDVAQQGWLLGGTYDF
jgi:hypothetical protein